MSRDETPDMDEGSAVVEFLAATLVLLVPITYLILTFAAVQAASFAAESAARESSRIYARAHSLPEAVNRSHQATYLAFSDHGIDVDPAQVLSVTCEHDPCLTPGAGVRLRLDVHVPLPLMPDLLSRYVPASIRVNADAFAVVDRFRGEEP